MIIKAILIVALLLIQIYALSQVRRAVLIAASMSFVTLVGAVFVLAPDLANMVANEVGVGRGADLILYCFVVATLAAVFNIHLRLRAEHETTTVLAREIAIMSATRSE